MVEVNLDVYWLSEMTNTKQRFKSLKYIWHAAYRCSKPTHYYTAIHPYPFNKNKKINPHAVRLDVLCRA